MNPDIAAGQPPPARAAFVTSMITFGYLCTTERAAAAVLLPLPDTYRGDGERGGSGRGGGTVSRSPTANRGK
jgi:hypothetical protein